MYPGVEVINATVTGGSGVNARALLKMRMLGGDPPDSFQVHAGQELIGTWVVANRMEDLTPLYKSEGWTTKLPSGLIKLLSTQGRDLERSREYPPLERDVVHPREAQGLGRHASEDLG